MPLDPSGNWANSFIDIFRAKRQRDDEQLDRADRFKTTDLQRQQAQFQLDKEQRDQAADTAAEGTVSSYLRSLPAQPGQPQPAMAAPVSQDPGMTMPPVRPLSVAPDLDGGGMPDNMKVSPSLKMRPGWKDATSQAISAQATKQAVQHDQFDPVALTNAGLMSPQVLSEMVASKRFAPIVTQQIQARLGAPLAANQLGFERRQAEHTMTHQDQELAQTARVYDITAAYNQGVLGHYSKEDDLKAAEQTYKNDPQRFQEEMQKIRARTDWHAPVQDSKNTTALTIADRKNQSAGARNAATNAVRVQALNNAATAAKGKLDQAEKALEETKAWHDRVQKDLASNHDANRRQQLITEGYKAQNAMSLASTNHAMARAESARAAAFRRGEADPGVALANDPSSQQVDTPGFWGTTKSTVLGPPPIGAVAQPPRAASVLDNVTADDFAEQDARRAKRRRH